VQGIEAESQGEVQGHDEKSDGLAHVKVALRDFLYGMANHL
jgi:hypothetical protein